MPAAGRKPNEGQPVRHRTKPVHQWTEIDGVPYEAGPELPPKRGKWSPATLRWWDAIRRMPHCVLWDESDWQFAMDTARVAATFHAGNMKAATELRQREKVMGTTVDSRRDLRIRYVEPAVDVPAGISAIAEYQDRLGKKN